MENKKLFLMQKPMLNVCYALMPIVLAATYLFGLRCLFLMVVVLAFGIAAEAVFTLKQGKPVTSAVFVTCLIYTLSLPPTIPIWMAVIGIVTGVVFGKMVFGGFGQNVFNPAMVGRCFIYIAFPKQMTNIWIEPMWGGYGGFSVWRNAADAVTRATPMTTLDTGIFYPFKDLFFGNVSGSMGETSAALILLGAIFIIYKKSAQWRLALSCLLGGLITSIVLRWTNPDMSFTFIFSMVAGSFLFGCAFVVTEPISGAKTRPGQWIYGFLVGGLTMILRVFSNFAEGFMFSILLLNAFVPIIDQTVAGIQKNGKIPMNKMFYSIGYMLIICFFFTSLVSVAKLTNAERIHRNQQLKLQRTILQVLQVTDKKVLSPDALFSLFEKRVKTIHDKDRKIYAGYEPDGQTIKGYAFVMGGPGFWGPIYGMVAVNPTASKILGISFYKHSETPGLGGRISEAWFTDQFKGLPLIPAPGDKKIFTLTPENESNAPNELDAITGASGTSRAVEIFLNRDLNRILTQFNALKIKNSE